MKSTSPSPSRRPPCGAPTLPAWQSLLAGTLRLGVLACLGLLATSCVTDSAKQEPQDQTDAQSPPSVEDDQFTPYWLDVAKNAQGHRPVDIQHRPPPVPPPKQTDGSSQAPLVPPQPEPELPTKKVSLVMRDADSADVILALARAADINVLVSPDVTGTTTVELRDVPWNEAFAGLLANLGLHHRWMGGILRVMTADSLQKEIDIEKLEKDRELVRHERRQVEPLVLQTIPIHYASAAKLQPILQDLLTSLDKFQTTGDETLANRVNRRRGSVAVDEENNALVINALRDDILKMIEVITALDKPKYQVLIEAKIIVANRQTARELGFQWGGLYKGGNSYIFPGSSSGVAGTGLGTAISPVLGNISNFPSSNFTSTTTSSTGTGTGTGTTDTGTGTDSTSTAGTTGLNLGYAYQNLGDLILTAQLTALESEGKAQIIATPSISTLDNEEATLKSGFEIPYQSYSANEGSDVQFKEALLQLTVTPHVIDGQMVKIRLTASNDEPDYSRVDSGITAEPAISRRTAETSLLLFNGETTVIGGLSRTYGSDAISGVPVLKDIPGLGKLFRSKAREKRQEDMLIFITPYILGEPTAPTAAKAASQPAQGNAAPEAKTGAAKDVPEAAKP